ncbi:DMT family transporter [Saccharospirillum salsuginis]|uniref:EamA family transporter n=1 Tax=Saccharospirillum salsuginis TaxID=418750 RepID=A0A918KCQ5_9GAMM|nr:DMT family transporter [Saccharospirillum salsuginis]GGX59091.1 EamA family transporter [Saccharospirillum salsuginis]
MTGTFYVLLACLLWALDTLIRYPLLEAGVSTLHIVFLEHAFLLVMMVVIGRVAGIRLWSFQKRDWPALFVIGGLGSAIGTLAFTQAFSLMNPTLVILLQKLQPVVAVSLSALVLGERISRGFLVYLAACLLGSLLLIGEDLLPLFSQEDWFYQPGLDAKLLGYGLTLTAVVGWGASTVFGKQLSQRGHGTSGIMTGRFALGFAILLPWLLIAQPDLSQVAPTQVGWIGVMVLISGLLGMAFYYRGLRRIASRHSALAEMCFPVAAGLVNWVFLGFALSPLQMVGAVVLVSASLLVHYPGRTLDQNANQLTSDDLIPALKK